MSIQKKEYRGLLVCPNDHMYNANKYGDTCPNCGAKQEDKEKSIEEYEEILLKDEKDWVCGVLLCTNGINKGTIYEVVSGVNRIGRNPNMEIYISGDLNIMKDKHTIIIYDNKNKETRLLSVGTLGMLYVNEEVIYESIILNNYDKIEIGDSGFRYIEICGLDFNWESF